MNKRFLTVLGALPTAGPVMPPPLESEALAARRIAEGFVGDPIFLNPPSPAYKRILPGGVYLQGVPEQEVSQIVAVVLAAANTVKDHHMRSTGIVDGGFPREMWISRSGAETKLTVWCRFTVDNCPAGATMMGEAVGAVQPKLGASSSVRFEHGGMPWDEALDGNIVFRTTIATKTRLAQAEQPLVQGEA